MRRMTRSNDPVLIGLSLSPLWIGALERAAKIVSEQLPNLSDAEILERLMMIGITSVINNAPPASKAPCGQVGEMVVAIIGSAP